MDRQTAETLVSRIHAFGDYGFNKSHAAAYGLLAYYSTYLKAHFPIAFWASELSSWGPSGDHLAHAMHRAAEAGIPIRLPEINHSGVGFVPDSDPSSGTAIWGALSLIRGVGADSALRVVRERERGGVFRDYDDYLKRVGAALDQRVEESFRRAGAFRHLMGAQASGAQLSWLDEPGRSERLAVDCRASFGLTWPVAEGPLYLSLAEGQNWDRRLVQDVQGWAARHPGPVALIAVIGQGRGKQLGLSGSAEYAGLTELKRIAGMRRVTRRVIDVATYEEEAP
jgi:DNA polymerase-3 subunit alpha